MGTTEAKTRPVTFISFANDLQVIREPRRPIFVNDGAGNVSPGGITEGDTAVFQNRKFTTDDPVMIEYLRGHDLFNKSRGFREDYESARPSFEEQLDRITNFAVEADVEGLRELIAVEESAGDHGRGNVLGPARKTLEQLERQREQVEQAALAEAEQERIEAEAAAAERAQTDGGTSEGESATEPSAEAGSTDDATERDGPDAPAGD